MKIMDQNGWLKPPENSEFVDVRVEGSFLKLTYLRYTSEVVPGTSVTIYLNDQGREVLRTEA